MSRIADELRTYAKDAEHGIGTHGTVVTPQWMRELADRIDCETVELPKDADGIPIHIRDTVYTPKGSRAFVTEINLFEHITHIKVRTSKEEHLEFYPAYISHRRPDSWERIAYDIETVVPIDDEGDERLSHELADRIRKLAKEGQQ